MIRQEIAHLLTRVNSRELRKFGLTIGIVLAAISAVLFWKGSTAALPFAIAAALLVATGLLLPDILKPVYVGWMSFAIVLGFFMTKVILTLLFVIVFAPAGIIMRLLGKDPLKQNIDRGASTYWIMRDKAVYDPVSTEKQY